MANHLTAVPEPSDALGRVIQSALRMQEHDEVDHWDFAYDVREAIDEQLNPEMVSGYHTGLAQAIEDVRLEIKRAGATDVAKAAKIEGAYKTAAAWAPTERIEGANYWAHYELRASEYDGRRQGILRKLVERSTDGRVGTPDVRLWKSSRKTPEMVPWLDQIDKGLRGILKRKVVSWSQLGEEDRRAIVKMLQQIANEVASEEFGR